MYGTYVHIVFFLNLLPLAIRTVQYGTSTIVLFGDFIANFQLIWLPLDCRKYCCYYRRERELIILLCSTRQNIITLPFEIEYWSRVSFFSFLP